MWIIQSVLLHLAFLGSVFVIYFRSPIISGLNPQKDLINPPAKRLVLIVTDGLRAESFFKNNLEHIPNIKKIVTNLATVGISRTRVPTESRPGHIAIISGFYEDPSSVTKGWKENPIDFDSIFNRSRKTFAWGSHDILSIFSKGAEKNKIHLFAYDHALDFSGKEKTYYLDTWVFSRIKSFLKENAENLIADSKVIFFLHLLGLDSAGHIYKPGTERFYENLKITDAGIYEVYNLFETVFGDKKTAYILTSDHGMTDAGSHGSGHFFETDTPLVIWGAGVSNWRSLKKVDTDRYLNINELNIPIIEMEQASITPLMASLLGVAPPVNNYGRLRLECLNAPMDFVARAFINNALQILSQYEKLLNEFQQGHFSKWLPHFDKLKEEDVLWLRSDIDQKLNNNEYSVDQVIQRADQIMINSIEGLEYYHTYYKGPLLFCTTLAFIGWIVYLLQILYGVKTSNIYDKEIYFGSIGISAALMSFIYGQKMPFALSIYFFIPIICWIPVLKRIKQISVQFWTIFSKNFFIVITGSELLVASFFRRELISIGLITLSVIERFVFSVQKKNAEYFIWSLSTIFLSIFPFLPNANGYKNDLFLILGSALWFLKSYFNGFHKNKIYLCFSIISLISLSICIYLHNNSMGMPLVMLILNWVLAGTSCVIPVMLVDSQQKRLRTIFHYFEKYT